MKYVIHLLLAPLYALSLCMVYVVGVTMFVGFKVLGENLFQILSKWLTF